MHSKASSAINIDEVFDDFVNQVRNKAKTEGICIQIIEDEINWIEHRRHIIKNLNNNHHVDVVCTKLRQLSFEARDSSLDSHDQ